MVHDGNSWILISNQLPNLQITSTQLMSQLSTYLYLSTNKYQAMSQAQRRFYECYIFDYHYCIQEHLFV